MNLLWNLDAPGGLFPTPPPLPRKLCDLFPRSRSTVYEILNYAPGPVDPEGLLLLVTSVSGCHNCMRSLCFISLSGAKPSLPNESPRPRLFTANFMSFWKSCSYRDCFPSSVPPSSTGLPSSVFPTLGSMNIVSSMLHSWKATAGRYESTVWVQILIFHLPAEWLWASS